jgi:ATP-binding cassette subfamily C (CFTR/MRP) protein 4
LGKASSSVDPKIALENISLTFKDKALYCVIGKVGSGKSALLQALAGELPVSSGRIIKDYSSVAYAAQDPWIMDGSVRENITMGLPYKEDWYHQVVDACGLVPDIDGFLHGDLTIVGDRGVQCSGGQKARIGLARALYRDADVLLLDDPLSAVDSKVARSIYYSAIQSLGVNRGKCVILVTHQHQFVGSANNTCILLDGGKVVCCGSFADCVEASSGTISEALQTEEGEEDVSREEKEPNRLADFEMPISQKKDTEGIADDAQIEKRKTGIVQFSTWSSYGKAMGGLASCLAFFVVFTVTQASLLVTIVQLGKWADEPATEQVCTSV